MRPQPEQHEQRAATRLRLAQPQVGQRAVLAVGEEHRRRHFGWRQRRARRRRQLLLRARIGRFDLRRRPDAELGAQQLGAGEVGRLDTGGVAEPGARRQQRGVAGIGQRVDADQRGGGLGRARGFAMLVAARRRCRQRALQQLLVFGAAAVAPGHEAVRRQLEAFQQAGGLGRAQPRQHGRRRRLRRIGQQLQRIGAQARQVAAGLQRAAGQPQRVGVADQQLQPEQLVDFVAQAAQPRAADVGLGIRPQQLGQLAARRLVPPLAEVDQQRQAALELQRRRPAVDAQFRVGTRAQFDARRGSGGRWRGAAHAVDSSAARRGRRLAAGARRSWPRRARMRGTSGPRGADHADLPL